LFAELDINGRIQRLEYTWIDAPRADAPLIVFLHEGLGSLAMWRDFPRALCAAAGMRGLVYSRYAYGRSTPRPPGEKWPVDFMHEHAHAVLPAIR
jgi:pimeloyl-ACP methyl ester carboxylesterase